MVYSDDGADKLIKLLIAFITNAFGGIFGNIGRILNAIKDVTLNQKTLEHYIFSNNFKYCKFTFVLAGIFRIFGVLFLFIWDIVILRDYPEIKNLLFEFT